MQNHPDFLWLRLQLECESLVKACRAMIALAETGVCPDIVNWSIPASAQARKGVPAAILSEVEAGARTLKQETATLTFADGGTVSIFRRPEEQLVRAEFSYVVTEVGADVRRGVLRSYRSWAEALCQRRLVTRGHSSWTGPGADCLPDVPLAGMRGQIVVTDEAAVREAYDDPDLFWAAWDERRDIGEKVLLVRALDAVDGPEFLERVIEQQWALARAARPGCTGYGHPRLTADENAIYHRGKRHMRMVGYDPKDGVIELACASPPGTHMHGWEIFDLWHPLVTGKTLDGRKIKQVKVVFLERTTAEQEKRPLLDIGARVFFQGPSGDVELSS